MIRLEGVVRRFGERDASRVALDDVSLNVRQGEIFGVVGRSGAGKSTLVRTINLLERPDRGRVIVDDRDLSALTPSALRAARRQIGMIFQHFNLLHNRTIRRNIALPLELEGRSRGAVAARVEALLAQLGLGEHADKYPAQLSGGQKQRVGIARALACEPKVLLCDEATSALDPETTEDILALLDGLNRDLGLTIVLITHEMDVVRRVCDRVAVMEAGRIVEQGDVADIFLHPKTEASRSLLIEGRPASDAPMVGERRVRLVFRGGGAFDPVLSRVARETGADFAILSGRVGRLRNEAYGELEMALYGPAVDTVLDRFREAGVAVELLA